MKHIYYLLLLGTIATSCSKKNNTSPTTSIVGKWVTVSDTIYSIASNGTKTYVSGPNTIPGTYLLFNKDGNGLTYTPAYDGESESTDHFTYTYIGSDLTLIQPAQTIDNNQVPASTTVVQVVKLTDKILTTQYNDSETDGKGNTINYTTIEHWSK